MAGFKLNDFDDIDVDSSGKMLRLVTYQELVKQRIQIKLKAYKGEWFLDTSFGIPYRDTGDGKAIIGKGFTQRDIDAVYIAAIKEDPDVLSIEYFKSTLDRTARGYGVSFEVKSRKGNLPLNNPSTYAWEDESYEYIANNITPLYDIGQWALDIHPIVHEDMPEALQPPYEWLPT
jgi:hypothetical protein